MTAQPLDTSSLNRIVPGPAADALGRSVYSALLADLAQLTAADWQRPTDCTGWTVRDVVAHLVGAAEGHGSMTVWLSQYVWGMRHRQEYAGSSLDAMNHKQIDDQRALPDAVLPHRLAELSSAAVAGRSRRARWLGWAPIGLDEAGSWTPGMPSRTTMGELCAVVLTRDVWAHRLDIARALGTTPALDPDLDRAIVADLVADWAQQHGQPVTLVLTGDAGGTFRTGADGPTLTLDGLDFARILSGRRPDADVPSSPLWRTKLLF
jgi:uncharacterized protein (TIGR03083 family)